MLLLRRPWLTHIVKHSRSLLVALYAAQLRSQSCMWCRRQALAPLAAAATATAMAAAAPAPTACCLEISSLVPCIGFASPLLMLALTPNPPSPPCCCCWNSKICAMWESADVLEQLPAGSLSKLHKCQLVSSYRTLFSYSSPCPLLCLSCCCRHWGALTLSEYAFFFTLHDVPEFWGIDVALSQCQCQRGVWKCGQYVNWIFKVVCGCRCVCVCLCV